MIREKSLKELLLENYTNITQTHKADPLRFIENGNSDFDFDLDINKPWISLIGLVEIILL